MHDAAEPDAGEMRVDHSQNLLLVSIGAREVFFSPAEEGNKLTPREMFHACNRMIDLITDFHEEGLVCDYIDNGYLILGLDEKVL